MLIIFDTETGGLQPQHPTIQLAAISVDDQFNELGYFEKKIAFREDACDPEALALNSYSRDAWKGASSEQDVVAAFAAFLNQYKSVQCISKRTGNPYMVARLAGHNAASFDGPRLKALFEKYKTFLPAHPIVLDTLQLALWRFMKAGKTPASYKLADLCQACGIPSEGAHDALADCRMTLELMRVLLNGRAK